MMEVEFYIDYDEDPKLGGQQGVFWLKQPKSFEGLTFSEKLQKIDILDSYTDEEGRIIMKGIVS